MLLLHWAPDNTLIDLNDTSRQFCQVELDHLAPLIKLTSKAYKFLLGIFSSSVLFRAFTEGYLIRCWFVVIKRREDQCTRREAITRKITFCTLRQQTSTKSLFNIRPLPLLFAWTRVDWWQSRLTGQYYEQTFYLFIS